MRFAGSFVLSLPAVALVISMARADDLAVSSNPYSSIPERNVFALVPIPPPPDPSSQLPPPDPPPKITVNGTMSIFGKPQVLFKYALKALPGQQPKEQSGVLGEGERQDDIEVTKIDMVGRMVSFVNHGIAQDIPVADVAKLTAPVPPPPGMPGINPAAVGGGVPLPTPSPAPAPVAGVGRGTRKGSMANGYTQPDQTAGAATAATGTAGSKDPIEDQVMGLAKQMAQVELNRIATQDQVDKGIMPALPPTDFTPSDAHANGGGGGSSLIANPPTGTKTKN